MGQLQIRTYSQILRRMVGRVVARTDLTDLAPTAMLLRILTAAADEDDEQYYQILRALDVTDLAKAERGDLDELIKLYGPDFPARFAASKGTATAVFSRTGTTGTVAIAQGTLIQAPAAAGREALVYSTTATGQITHGASASSPIPIAAAEAGARYNVAAGAIIAFGSARPTGVESVTNDTPVINASDGESDDALRQRARLYTASLSRGTPYALQSAALGTEVSGQRIVAASVIEDEIARGNVTVYVDDGAGTAETTTAVTDQVVLAAAVGGERRIALPSRPVKIEAGYTVKRNTVAMAAGTAYVLDPAAGVIILGALAFPTGLTAGDAITFTGTYYTGLIAECQKIIDGDPADRVNYPGFRAAGVLVRVIAPTIVQLRVVANLTTVQGATVQTAIDQAASDMATYVNGLGVGEDVILNELRARAMAVPGVYDVTFTEPTANRPILDHQLARLSTADITLT